MRCLAAPQGAPAVGKYSVDVRSFESLALPQLAPSAGTQLYVIDEVGKMELFSRSFYPAVQALLDTAPLVLGTVPVARQGRAIPQVGKRGKGPAELRAAAWEPGSGCGLLCPGRSALNASRRFVRACDPMVLRTGLRIYAPPMPAPSTVHLPAPHSAPATGGSDQAAARCPAHHAHKREPG